MKIVEHSIVPRIHTEIRRLLTVPLEALRAWMKKLGKGHSTHLESVVGVVIFYSEYMVVNRKEIPVRCHKMS